MFILFTLKNSSSLLIFLPLGILAPTDTPEILLPFSFKGMELLTPHYLMCVCVAEGLGLELMNKNNFMNCFLSHSVRLCSHFCHKNTLSAALKQVNYLCERFQLKLCTELFFFLISVSGFNSE